MDASNEQLAESLGWVNQIYYGMSDEYSPYVPYYRICDSFPICKENSYSHLGLDATGMEESEVIEATVDLIKQNNYVTIKIPMDYDWKKIADQIWDRFDGHASWTSLCIGNDLNRRIVCFSLDES